jgi:hypothetical protein
MNCLTKSRRKHAAVVGVSSEGNRRVDPKTDHTTRRALQGRQRGYDLTCASLACSDLEGPLVGRFSLTGVGS